MMTPVICSLLIGYDYNMKTETVSIILATQNREKFLPRALDSIAAQTYKDYTLYVIDDASTDSTMEIIERYVDVIPSLVIHKNPKALGQCNSLIKMIQLSKWKYIARIDDDDIWLPEKLEKQVAFMESHQDIALLGTAIQWITSSGIMLATAINPSTDEVIRKNLLQVNQFAHASIMIRREMYEKVWGYNSNFTVEDYELWMRIGSQGGKFANLEEVLTHIGVTEGQISIKRRKKFIRSEIRAVWKYRAFYPGLFRALIKRFGAFILPEKYSREIGSFLRKYTSF